jgi:hypothetical protein
VREFPSTIIYVQFVVFKLRKLRWNGLVSVDGRNKNAFLILVYKSLGSRPLGMNEEKENR